MPTKEFTDEEALKYFLDHIAFYDEVKILSYTPCFLLNEEQSKDNKRRYARALLERCYSGKAETVIYVAESGLKTVSAGNQESIASNLAVWEKLASFSKLNPDNLRINVVKDEFLPCVSFVLGHVPDLPWGERAPWDLLIEYRVGVQPDQLFRTGGADDEITQYEYRLISGELPKGIRWIIDKLKSDIPLVNFESWINESKIKYSRSPPQIAVLSAMSREVPYYRRGLPFDDLFEIKEYPGHQFGQIKLRDYYHTIDFPPTYYGRYQAFKSVTTICNQFKSLKTCIFVGCAGGYPGENHKRLNIGDVVISTQIIDLYHEKLITKENIEKMKDKIKQDVIDIPSASLELRVHRYDIDDGLCCVAQGLCDKWDQKRWTDLVDKYLRFCSKDYEKAKQLGQLINPPKIHLGKIWSSDHNINDIGFRNLLYKKFDATAFEMEGGGFAEGARAFGKKFIEIRGISDFADGNRDNDEVYQSVALAVASACAEALLLDILA